MLETKVAKRYAKSLIGLAAENGIRLKRDTEEEIEWVGKFSDALGLIFKVKP